MFVLASASFFPFFVFQVHAGVILFICIFLFSVAMQSTAWKDASPKWTTVCPVGRKVLLTQLSSTQIFILTCSVLLTFSIIDLCNIGIKVPTYRHIFQLSSRTSVQVDKILVWRWGTAQWPDPHQRSPHWTGPSNDMTQARWRRQCLEHTEGHRRIRLHLNTHTDLSLLISATTHHKTYKNEQKAQLPQR